MNGEKQYVWLVDCMTEGERRVFRTRDDAESWLRDIGFMPHRVKPTSLVWVLNPDAPYTTRLAWYEDTEFTIEQIELESWT